MVGTDDVEDEGDAISEGNHFAVHPWVRGLPIVPIEVRQIKYLNNIVEQDHRFIKRVTRPMLGFKSFRAASAVLAGIELMHMIRKGQLSVEKGKNLSFAEQFYALAA